MNFEIFGVLILSVVLAVVLAAYDKLLRELKRLKQEKETIELRARHRAMKVVEDARDRALEIMQKANAQMQRDRGHLDTELQKVSSEQLDEYKQVLQNISKAVENNAMRELDEFKQALQMGTTGAQKIVEQKIEDEYAKARLEVQDYKKSQMEKVDKHVVELLERVVTKAANKALTIDQHADLVIEALREAKTQHVI